MIMNGTGDFAVRFSDLKTGFDQLKSDFNNFITQKYNLHTHPVIAVGSPTSPTTLIGTSSTSSIDSAKIDTIEVPS